MKKKNLTFLLQCLALPILAEWTAAIIVPHLLQLKASSNGIYGSTSEADIPRLLELTAVTIETSALREYWIFITKDSILLTETRIRQLK